MKYVRPEKRKWRDIRRLPSILHHMQISYNTMPATNLLTPPATPQVEYEGFQFGMEQTTVNQTSELEVEGLPR